MKYLQIHKKFVWATIISALLTVNVAGYLSAYALTNYRSPDEKDRFALGYSRPKNNRTPQDFGLAYSSDRLKINSQEWIFDL